MYTGCSRILDLDIAQGASRFVTFTAGKAAVVTIESEVLQFPEYEFNGEE
jgi:hypothetical protein